MRKKERTQQVSFDQTLKGLIQLHTNSLKTQTKEARDIASYMCDREDKVEEEDIDVKNKMEEDDLGLVTVESRTSKLMSILEKEEQMILGDRGVINELCCEYSDIFHLPEDKLTCTTIRKFAIPLKEGMGVVNQKQYRMAHAHKEKGVRQIKALLNDDLIEPSVSPFNSPVLMIPKKGLDENDKPKMLMCVDFRKLNEKIIPFNFPLPHIDDTIQQLRAASGLLRLTWPMDIIR